MNALDGGAPTTCSATAPRSALLSRRALDPPGAQLGGSNPATPSTPVSDPVAGTGPSPDDVQRHQQDQETLRTLADQLAQHLGAVPGTDPVAGTPDTHRARAVAIMERVIQASDEAMVADPSDAGHAGASLLVRRALHLPLQADLPSDTATLLLHRITGLDDPYEITRAVQSWATLPAEQRNLMYSPNPDIDDPVVQATLEDLTRADQPQIQQDALAAVAPPDVKIQFGPSMKSGITKVRRWFSGTLTRSRYPPHSSYDGQLAHTIIGLHYLQTHIDHPVILDLYAWSPALGPTLPLMTTLTQAATTGGPFAAVRALLTSAVTGFVGRPDILDLATNEVYEIKPWKEMAEGASQLAVYLLRLNTGVLGSDALARKLIGALTPTGIDPHLWTAPNPDVRPFLPGSSWYPSQVYPLPDGRFMFVVRPVQGVIGYQILGNEQATADGPSYTELTNLLWAALAALAILAARSLATTPQEQDIPTSGAYPSPVGRSPIDLDALRIVALVTGTAVATELLLAVTADLISALAPLLLLLL